MSMMRIPDSPENVNEAVSNSLSVGCRILTNSLKAFAHTYCIKTCLASFCRPCQNCLPGRCHRLGFLELFDELIERSGADAL